MLTSLTLRRCPCCFDLRGACIVRKVSLTLGMRNMWYFLSYLGSTHSFLMPASLAAQPGTHLSSTSLDAHLKAG